jgi:hypothetical protein
MEDAAYAELRSENYELRSGLDPLLLGQRWWILGDRQGNGKRKKYLYDNSLELRYDQVS